MDKFLPQAFTFELFRIGTKRAPILADFVGPIVGFGSCLGAEVLLHLAEVGFKTSFDLDYAIHYGLESISHFLDYVTGERAITEEDVLEEDDGAIMVYPLNLVDLRFRGANNKERALGALRRNVEACKKTLQSAALVVITCATARVIRLNRNGRSVARTRMLDEKHYSSTVLSVEEQVAFAHRVVAQIAAIRGSAAAIPFVFLISPQRYPFEGMCAREGRDPFVDHIRCKSVVRVALEQVVEQQPNRLFYFPAYEMVLEELRVFDSLLHYDQQHVSRLTNPYLAKRFLQTYATSDVLDQLNLAVEAVALKQQIAVDLQGGVAAGDPRVAEKVAALDEKLRACSGPQSPLIRRARDDLGKLLARADARA